MGNPAAFWNQRYDTDDYLFGTEPNDFIRAVTPLAAPGMKAFAPADGEGRNGAYLASLGYAVDTIDVSHLAVDKAQALAQQKGVQLNARVGDALAEDWPANHYDLIIVVFMHFLPDDHQLFMQKICASLKTGGLFIMEGYTPRQIPLSSGGPKNPDMLYTAASIRNDLPELEFTCLHECRRNLAEGPRHQGEAEVLQVIARKPE